MADETEIQQKFAPGTILEIPESETYYSSINKINSNFTNLIARVQYLAENKISDPLVDIVNKLIVSIKATPTQSYAKGTTVLKAVSLVGLDEGFRLINISPNPTTTDPFPLDSIVTKLEQNTITLDKPSTMAFNIGDSVYYNFINPEKLKEYEYNLLTWNTFTNKWDSLPYTGFGDIAARAWVTFEVTGPKQLRILAKYNIKSVTIGTEGGHFGTSSAKWFYTVTTVVPFEVPEACIIVNGHIPNAPEVCPPQAGTYGVPYGEGIDAKKVMNQATKRWPAPETLYKDQQTPREFRNNFSIFWRPNFGNGLLDTGTIISAVVYSRTYNQSLLYRNPIETVLGYTLSDFAK